MRQMPQILDCIFNNGAIKYRRTPEIFFNDFQTDYIFSSSSKLKGILFRKHQRSFFFNITYTDASIDFINCHGYHAKSRVWKKPI